jgi:hypothetical protein
MGFEFDESGDEIGAVFATASVSVAGTPVPSLGPGALLLLAGSMLWLGRQRLATA